MGLLGIALVIVLIMLFINFPEEMTCIVLVLIILTILAIVSFFVYEKHRDALKKSVAVSVVYSLSSCNHSYPLLIGIRNNSSKTVKKVEWWIEVYIPGHSTNIAGVYNNYSCDKILKPGEVFTSCYELPGMRVRAKNLDFGSLRYVISSKYVDFVD